MNVSIFCSSRDTSLCYEKETIEAISILQEYGINKVIYRGVNKGLMGVVYRESERIYLPIEGHNLKKWSSDDYGKEIVYTGLTDRKKSILDESTIFLVLPGGIGTIYELCQALYQNDTNEIIKPVVIYNINRVFDLFITFLIQNTLVDIDKLLLYEAKTPDELRTIFRELKLGNK